MGADVTWQLIVTNADDRDATLVFGTAQPGDVVLAQDGEEIFRWSLARDFAAAVRCFTLEPGARARLDLEDILEINDGEYELTATVASEPAPPAVKRTITVAAP